MATANDGISSLTFSFPCGLTGKMKPNIWKNSQILKFSELLFLFEAGPKNFQNETSTISLKQRPTPTKQLLAWLLRLWVIIKLLLSAQVLFPMRETCGFTLGHILKYYFDIAFEPRMIHIHILFSTQWMEHERSRFYSDWTWLTKRW